MRPSTVPSQLSSVEKVSVAGKNGLVTDCERPVPENDSSAPKIHCPSCRLAPPMMPPITPLGEKSMGVFAAAAAPAPVLNTLASVCQLRSLQVPPSLPPM